MLLINTMKPTPDDISPDIAISDYCGFSLYPSGTKDSGYNTALTQIL